MNGNNKYPIESKDSRSAQLIMTATVQGTSSSMLPRKMLCNNGWFSDFLFAFFSGNQSFVNDEYTKHTQCNVNRLLNYA